VTGGQRAPLCAGGRPFEARSAVGSRFLI